MPRTRAFTLLELMVVMAMAALLSFIAASVWQAHRERMHRAAAGTALVAVLAQLEFGHARTGTFEEELRSLSPVPRVDGYTVTTRRCADQPLAQCVEVLASPRRTDAVCGKLVLRSTGERLPTDPACWP